MERSNTDSGRVSEGSVGQQLITPTIVTLLVCTGAAGVGEMITNIGERDYAHASQNAEQIVGRIDPTVLAKAEKAKAELPIELFRSPSSFDVFVRSPRYQETVYIFNKKGQLERKVEEFKQEAIQWQEKGKWVTNTAGLVGAGSFGLLTLGFGIDTGRRVWDTVQVIRRRTSERRNGLKK